MIRRACEVLTGIMLMLTMLFPSANTSEIDQCFGEYPLLGYVIVLDAGHGGEDGGAIGINTLTHEKEINLKITQKIGRLFESAGATVVLTRENDNALCQNEFIKMEDMLNRAEIIETVKPYIVISVHCNSFPENKTVSGAQMFYFPGSASGQMLAESIQNSIRTYVDSENNRVPKAEDFFMLRHGNSVNVMIECGFLSTPEDERLLLDDDYQNNIAYSVFCGTCDFVLNTSIPGNM